jgi:hypothetical protein
VSRIEVPGSLRPSSIAKLSGVDIAHHLQRQEDHVLFTLDKEVTIRPEKELTLQC